MEIKLDETRNQRRLHLGSFFVDLNENEYQELVRIFSRKSLDGDVPDLFVSPDEPDPHTDK